MSFAAQSQLARSKTKAYKFQNTYRKNQLQYASPRLDFGTTAWDYHVGAGVKAAYDNKQGYSIKTNPRTGDKEMFVRGTTFKGQGREWFSNAIEVPAIGAFAPAPYQALRKHSIKRRKQFADKLSEIAKRAGVTQVWGHSRGATVVADMKGPFRRDGLDGAFLLADRRGKSGMTNYRQKQAFDAMIGLGAPRTVKSRGYTPIWKYKKYHSVWK